MGNLEILSHLAFPQRGRFTWGRRDYSGLGGGSDDVTIPTKLKLTSIRHIAAGGSHVGW